MLAKSKTCQLGLPTTFCLVALLLLTGTTSAQTLDDPNLSLSTVTGGLSQPTGMAFVAPNDILVLQKANGQVRRVLNGTLQGTPALDVNVNFSSERGLLGIAVNTESPPKVFLFYTEANGFDGGTALGNRVYSYDWNPGSGTLTNPNLILDLPVSPGPNHDGGILVMGPPPIEAPEGGVGDGAPLYVVIGDLNRNNQLENFPNGGAPDDSAVILRVQQDGSAYPGNPFTPYCSITTSTTCTTNGNCPGGETCVTAIQRYWAYGVRNSFGMALDPVTGFLWNTENGPGSMDEVNLVPRGFNSGWEPIMGPDSRDPSNPDSLWVVPNSGAVCAGTPSSTCYSDPEFSWLSTIAPTSIVFPANSRLGSDYQSVALVGDNNTGRLFEFPLNVARNAFDFSAFPGLQDLVADSTTERNLLSVGSGFSVMTDMEIGPDGALYIVALATGSIYRIEGTLQSIFSNGFESGGTTAWTQEVVAP